MMTTRLMTAAQLQSPDPKPSPAIPTRVSMGFANNALEVTTLTTTTQSPIKPVTARRVRRQTIGRSPPRTERIDFKTPCRKCGNAPTCMVKLGPVVIERTCHTCGDIEFFDAATTACLEVPDRVPEEDTAQTSPTGWSVCHENLLQPPLDRERSGGVLRGMAA